MLILVGAALRLRASALRRESGLPPGRVIYADTGGWRPVERPLFSARYRLAGKPDYLVDTKRGVVPVEVKSARTPAQPYEGHVMQLGAYCLLVEETTGRKPPFGIVRYPEATFRVDYTSSLRGAVIQMIRDIRESHDARSRDVHRSHDEPERCARCGFGDRCGESLVGTGGGGV